MRFPLYSYRLCISDGYQGAHVGFAGAVWIDRPHLQVLSPTLPLFYHATDVTMRMTAARHFGAAKKAISSLEHYYKHYIDALEPPPQPEFPHPNHFISVSDQEHHDIRYVAPLFADKLIFHAQTDGEDVCVKFVYRYSRAVHDFCASSGFAPRLRGFDSIPGGWWMVTMDYVNDEYEELEMLTMDARAHFHEEITATIEKLHQRGFVHGDIRASNILVKKNGEPGIKLIDFDWAGVIGEVRYPMNVNRVQIGRPEGAYDGELIMANHDIDMVKIVFTPIA